MPGILSTSQGTPFPAAVEPPGSGFIKEIGRLTQLPAPPEILSIIFFPNALPAKALMWGYRGST